MSSNDPFSQLAFYMKKQKITTAPKNPKPPSPKTSNTTNKYPKSLNYIDNHKPQKNARKHENWQDLMDKTVQAPKQVAVSPYRNRDHQTKNRVFYQPPNNDSVKSELDNTRPKKIQAVIRTHERSISAKSYDFTKGQPDRDEINAKKVEIKKAKIITDYEQYKHYWNKETGAVYDVLKNGLENKKSVQMNGYKANDYEDPKVTKMKQIMNQHKELLKAQEPSRIVIGGNAQTEPKGRGLSPLKYKYDFQSKIDIFGRETSANRRYTVDKQELKRINSDVVINESLKRTASTKTIEITATRKTLLEEFKANKMIRNEL